MWNLLVRVPKQEPQEFSLRPGKNRVGRNPENEIPVVDLSASRLHAEIQLDPIGDIVTLQDLGSTNGTYVNRKRVTGLTRLNPNDTIRIGGTTLELTRYQTGEIPPDATGAHRYTRELVLESLDHQAVLLYEVARQLNTVMDLDTALREVSELMKKAMGADRCEVILAEKFSQMHELQFPETIAEAAIQQRSAVVVRDLESDQLGKRSGSSFLLKIKSILCVPVIAANDILGVIYMYKVSGNERAFSQKDLQLAVAISHQAALTIQRMHLIEKVRKEQQARELFQRFLSPAEAETMAHDYLETGYLPGLMEQEVTILFADIANSTNLAERVGAQKFGEILNRYYWDLTGVVFSHHGLVKYMGDGIMAIFGMIGKPEGATQVERHLMGGVQSAMTILNHIEVTDYGEVIEIGIGVNTGKAMVGYVGTQERVEITAVGDVANVAYRLQALARPNRLLIGPTTAAVVAGKLPLRDLGWVQLRGRTKPLRVYEVLHTMPETDREQANSA